MMRPLEVARYSATQNAPCSHFFQFVKQPKDHLDKNFSIIKTQYNVFCLLEGILSENNELQIHFNFNFYKDIFLFF